MKTKEELLVIARAAVDEAEGDQDRAIEILENLAEINPDIMLGFTFYGAEIIDSVMESWDSTIN